MVGAEGVEPSPQVPKTRILPLYDTPMFARVFLRSNSYSRAGRYFIMECNLSFISGPLSYFGLAVIRGVEPRSSG